MESPEKGKEAKEEKWGDREGRQKRRNGREGGGQGEEEIMAQNPQIY
jgi:hypothetical protein